MGEGVSLSFPRNGFPVVILFEVSVPSSREQGCYGRFNLLLLTHRSANGRRDTASYGARHALAISDRQVPGFLGAGVPTQGTCGEMPKSWNLDLQLTDPSSNIAGCDLPNSSKHVPGFIGSG